MAGASLFALIDDIATILDDVAILSKVAVQKTAGVLGDDLALNAHQLTGVDPKRELPVVLSVAKGSLVNKAILVPLALVLSVVLPWAVRPLLMIGGAYLCFEGCEKLLHKFFHSHDEDAAEHKELLAATADPKIDLVAFEKTKIDGAIRTDFVLSAEIIVIALGTVADHPFMQRLAVLVGVAIVMTVGVYGLVACIIKIDDLGLALCLRAGPSAARRSQRKVGQTLLLLAPWLLKFLSVAGTAAMFIVGGQILVHGIPIVHHFFDSIQENLNSIPSVGWIASMLASLTLEGLFGVLAGAVVLVAVIVAKKTFG